MHQIELEAERGAAARTQLELEASRERGSTSYGLAPVGYCSISKTGHIVQLNLAAAELLGLSRNELVQRLFTQLVEPGDLAAFYALRARVLETGERQQSELRLLVAQVRPDGCSCRPLARLTPKASARCASCWSM